MKHRVGGKDTVHIFHLPNGSSLLEADDSERAPQEGMSHSEGGRCALYPS